MTKFQTMCAQLNGSNFSVNGSDKCRVVRQSKKQLDANAELVNADLERKERRDAEMLAKKNRKLHTNYKARQARLADASKVPADKRQAKQKKAYWAKMNAQTEGCGVEHVECEKLVNNPFAKLNK
jgi:hypothetical protein